MNKAITEGLVLTPPQFVNGLDVWSSQDGTPGSDTYDGASNAAYVPADADFGGCLELTKTQSTQKLRYMGETPILPGCYMRVTARVKAISGNLPNVRIAGWAGRSGGAHVGGLLEVGPTTTIATYGSVVEVSAIIGSGARGGVDMVWANGAIYGHFGLDLTGSNGGVVRIDDIQIEDITSVFHRELMDWVDVKDYGAVGNGSTDDHAAFEAADAAANGREILVPAGTYHLGDSVTFENKVRFVGTVTMADGDILSLTKNFDLAAYIDAFGEELLAFRKAVQALFNYSDHESLDMSGRRISITAPIDMAAVTGRTSYTTRRAIRNGQFDVQDHANWDDDVVTSQATYSTSSATTLTGVSNIANVQVGSRVTGSGVGREIYVKEVNVGAQQLTLSNPLYDASGTQTYTFTRHKYVLDFSGFSNLGRFVLDDVEMKCNGHASAIMLARSGLIFHVRDCYINGPKDKGITSIGTGCQGMLIDRCQFLSSEQPMRAQDRRSIGFNVNANDSKVRDNRSVKFGHFGVFNGAGHLITGNHWFQGDNEPNGLAQAGIVFTQTNVKSTVYGNYVDNSFIEWTNEHNENPAFTSGFSFGGLTITSNIFTANDVASWFSWIVVKPYGPNHYISGFNVSGNTFKALNGNIDRVEYLDDSFAGINHARTRNLKFTDNVYIAVSEHTVSPISVRHTENSDNKTWSVDFSEYMPFAGWARRVEGLVAEGRINRGSNIQVTDMPYTVVQRGSAKNQVDVVWENSCKGTIHLVARCDNPI